MNILRIRNMFLLVTALAVMFILACGSSEITEETVIESNLLVKQGDDFIGSGKYQSAINYYTTAIKLNPENPHAYIGRAMGYFQLNQTDKIIDDYTKVIELNPNLTLEAWDVVYFGRATTYYLSGKFNKAIQDHTKLIELKPNHAMSYLGRGAAYAELGQYIKAIDDFSKGIDLTTDQEKLAVAYAVRGYTYYKLKQPDKALADYNKSIELNPNNPLVIDERKKILEEHSELKP